MFLRRRSYRISRSNRFGISKGSDTVLGYSSDMVFYQIVSYKDIKKLMSNLKNVYQAINEEKALEALDRVTEKWASLTWVFLYASYINKSCKLIS